MTRIYRKYRVPNMSRHESYLYLLDNGERTEKGCLVFPRCHPTNYRLISIHGKGHLVHRLIWEETTGNEIPKNIEVCHSCDNPPCYEYSHLFLGTTQDNQKDAVKKDLRADQFGQTHHTAKLLDKEVAEIRRLRIAENLSHAATASRFGVSREHVGDIIRNETRVKELSD